MKFINFAITVLFLKQVKSEVTLGKITTVDAIPTLYQQLALQVEWGSARIPSDESTKTYLFMKFDTYGAPVRDNVYIQVYASFADPVNIGQKETFTCSTLYERFVSYSFDVFVQNYYGKASFSQNNSGIYDRNLKEINREDLIKDGPWFADEEAIDVSYASGFKNFESTQKCAAARVV